MSPDRRTRKTLRIVIMKNFNYIKDRDKENRVEHTKRKHKKETLLYYY